MDRRRSSYEKRSMGSDGEDDGGLAMADREVKTVGDLITLYHRGRGKYASALREAQGRLAADG